MATHVRQAETAARLPLLMHEVQPQLSDAVERHDMQPRRCDVTSVLGKAVASVLAAVRQFWQPPALVLVRHVTHALAVATDVPTRAGLAQT